MDVDKYNENKSVYRCIACDNVLHIELIKWGILTSLRGWWTTIGASLCFHSHRTCARERAICMLVCIQLLSTLQYSIATPIRLLLLLLLAVVQHNVCDLRVVATFSFFIFCISLSYALNRSFFISFKRHAIALMLSHGWHFNDLIQSIGTISTFGIHLAVVVLSPSHSLLPCLFLAILLKRQFDRPLLIELHKAPHTHTPLCNFLC